LSSLLPVVLLAGGTTWVAGAALIALRARRPFADSLASWGSAGWLWWLAAGGWEGARLLAFATGHRGLQVVLSAAMFPAALILAGWTATFFTLCRREPAGGPRDVPARPGDGGRLPAGLWIAMAAYCLVFVTLNWQLDRGLLIPHGDSAQYEEHLWNVTHGKGFRSYIDPTSFLGEHIQVIHLLLLPLYVLWPTQRLLEACQSVALAAGAIPVFWLGARHTGSRGAGLLLACTYLLYPPTQALDIDVDMKTFRPEAFGIPLLLLAIDRLERGRLAGMVALGLAALSSREDYALVLAPLGVWVAASALARPRGPARTASFLTGLGLAAFATAYVLAVVKYVIPWFRGDEVHYVRYFTRLGGSLESVSRNLLTNPGLLLEGLLTTKTLLYATQLLLPLGFLPLLSPARLAIGAPLFVTLCLNELSSAPYHHFHAPVVPVLFWSAAAGLGNLGRLSRRASDPDPVPPNPSAGPTRPGRTAVERWASHFAWAAALSCGLFLSPTPLGVNFWDPGSWSCWRKVYVPGRRAELFERVYRAIPRDSRVASTDFIHPRFTHHERSYDYSLYPRAVNGHKPGAPPDTDYIVIDVRGRYNTFKTPEQVPEYRDHRGDWELLPDVTDGYFIVLKRRWPARGPGQAEKAPGRRSPPGLTRRAGGAKTSRGM
jgi:uncharacterized membrane protein